MESELYISTQSELPLELNSLMYKAAYIFCGKEKMITKQISDKSLVNNFTVISYSDLKGKAINFQPPLTPF